jgi:hypothetical protein
VRIAQELCGLAVDRRLDVQLSHGRLLPSALSVRRGATCQDSGNGPPIGGARLSSIGRAAAPAASAACLSDVERRSHQRLLRVRDAQRRRRDRADGDAGRV